MTSPEPVAAASEHAVEAQPRHRHVVIAGFASALVVPLLASPLAKAVTFEIREAEDDDALRDLGLGQVDLAIVQEYDGVPVHRSPRFSYTAVHRDRLRLVAPPDQPASLRLRDLSDEPWLVNGAGTRCQEATQAVLRAVGIRPCMPGTSRTTARLWRTLRQATAPRSRPNSSWPNPRSRSPWPARTSTPAARSLPWSASPTPTATPTSSVD